MDSTLLSNIKAKKTSTLQPVQTKGFGPPELEPSLLFVRHQRVFKRATQD